MNKKEIIQNLNKRAISDATGISYSKLRKYSSGLIDSLTPEEELKISEYLKEIAETFKR